MTTTTLPGVYAPAAGPATGVTFARVVRSEWIKLRTLRSTVWCFAIIAGLTIGFGILLAFTVSAPGTTPSGAGAMDTFSQNQVAVQVSTLGVNFTQLVAAVLGVLIITGEYSTGMIRSTFAAVPKRLPALFAKALILGVTTFLVSLVAIVVTALVTVPILGGKGIHPDLLNPGVMWVLLGGAGYLALVAVLSFAFGAILRNSAGGIATALGLILVLPPVLAIVSAVTRATWPQNVAAFLPSSAGGKMFELANPHMQVNAGHISLDGTQGLLVLLGWIVVILAIAVTLLKKRDA